MTPSQHAAVKAVFGKAIELPEHEREAFCIAETVGDAEVLREVQSLLKHHNDQTLLETMVLPSVPTPADRTAQPPLTMDEVDASRSPLPEGPSRRSRVAVVDDHPSSDLQERMDISSRKFLRRRLLITLTVLTFVMLAIRVGVLAFGDPARDNAVRFSLVIILGGAALFLKFRPSLSLRMLRALVAVAIVMPMIEIILIQTQESKDLALAGRIDEVPVLMLSVNLATVLFISLYSTFLPASWQRTALITGIMAITPSLIAWIQGQFSAPLADARMVPFTGPLLTMVSAAVATAGAHFVHRMRLEAEDARSYGQYRLLEEIGRGGMGVVYRAEHRMLKRPAAIKLIRSESATKTDVIKQFEQEVQISATLTHWNTVQIFDYGTTDAGDFFYVMEYLEGETLEQRLQRCGRISESETLAIALQVCDGLAEAHAKGMIHRDLKPANIFLAEIGGQSDIVKIVDFGLAVVASGDQRIAAAGTPGYMSPEQISGEPMDGRGDIYAIGCVLHECLTGDPVFPRGRLFDVLQSHLFKIPRYNHFTSVSPKFEKAIKKCLSKKADDRFSDVGELKRALLGDPP